MIGLGSDNKFTVFLTPRLDSKLIFWTVQGRNLQTWLQYNSLFPTITCPITVLHCPVVHCLYYTVCCLFSMFSFQPKLRHILKLCLDTSFYIYLSQPVWLEGKNSERPIDAPAVKTYVTHLLTTWIQEMLAHLKIIFYVIMNSKL